MHKTRIKKARKAVGLTQSALARKARLSRMRLVYAELGDLELDPGEVERLKEAIARAAERNSAQIARVLA